MQISGHSIKITLMPGLIIKDFAAKAHSLTIVIPNGSVKIHNLVLSGNQGNLIA